MSVGEEEDAGRRLVEDDGGAGPVDRVDVVGLDVGVDRELPVPVDLDRSAADEVHRADAVAAPDLVVQLAPDDAKGVEQRWGIAVEVDEHERAPHFAAHGWQAETCRVDLEVLRSGEADERPVEVVGPGVVAADQPPPGVAGVVGHDRTAAMLAGVEHGANRAVVSAYEQDRFRQMAQQEVVARFGQLVGVGHEQPALSKTYSRSSAAKPASA